MADILRANLFTRFNAILGALLVVVAVVGPVQDGLFGVVLVTNAAIGIAQELRAKRTLDRLAILNAPHARVVRDGATRQLAVEEVVPGDTIALQPGDQVVTDGVVLQATLLEVDESLVTGETEAVAKRAGDPLVSGSAVVAGDGTMSATSSGADSYASRLATEARRFVRSRSELIDGTNAILRMVTWVMVPTGAALVCTQLLVSHQSWADAVRGSVAGVAAMVPEGLVLLTSLAFAAGAVRLGRRHVLVEQLAAVEGLARVDVVCLDKTGTLTAPGLRLAHVHPLWSLGERGVEDVLAFVAAADPAPNATMRALRSTPPVGGHRRLVARVPFSSDRKWSSVSTDEGATWLLGAPEVIAREDPAVGRALARVGATCQRWVLLARADGALTTPTLPAGRTPVALVGLREELRPDAAPTVRYL
ncbi:MAG TPA: HAD-IC family P-type ATPase, partial [Acidimicrobiales bacterium]|nr:HAD-IC family P-type ATPase [Acidimicrobiales bacterium]